MILYRLMKFKSAISRSVKMFSSPEFIERIKEEDSTMLKHLNILKAINANGFITDESQAGLKRSGISKFLAGKKYEISERAYIAGFMLETKAINFIKNMSLSTDKNAIYIPFCNDNIFIPRSLDIPLTITKIAGKTEINTHMSVVLPESVWQSYRKRAHINKTEKVVFIECWDIKWNRNAAGSSGLFTDVLKILKSI